MTRENSQMTTPPRQSQPGAGSETNSSVPAARQEAQPVAWLNPDDHSEFSTIGRVGWTPLYTAPEQEARDAARYRWLRHGDNDEGLIRSDGKTQHWLLRNEELDSAIDAAMKEKP